MNHDSNREKSVARNVLSCLAIAFVTVTLAMLFLCGGLYLAYRTVFSFENYRAQMCIRKDLAVEDPHFVYSPGYDYIMWSKFDVRVDNIDKVFDAARIDVSKLREGYKMRSLTDKWWDAGDHELSGASFEVSDDETMDVGYFDNGDGTLTVYIYLVEV